MKETEVVTGKVSAVTPWEAALRFAQENGIDLEENAGYTFTVKVDRTGAISKFVVNDQGQVVPDE